MPTFFTTTAHGYMKITSTSNKTNKIATTEKATKLDILNIDEVNKKDFLSAKEAAYILNMSLRTVYRLIQSKELNAYNCIY